MEQQVHVHILGVDIMQPHYFGKQFLELELAKLTLLQFDIYHTVLILKSQYIK